MQSFSKRWEQFWFAPTAPAALGFCRFVAMLGAFLFYRTTDFESWGFVQPHLLQPIPLFEHMHWAPMSAMKMWALGFVWKGILLIGALGLFSRTCCALAFVLGLYLVGLPNNLGKVDHADAILLWSFLIMAIARSGDAWSLDALIRAARRSTPASVRSDRPAAGQDHAEYRWPMRMMQVLMAVVFCCAGTTKLRYTGYTWAWSDNLRNTFLERLYASKPALRWGLFFASFPRVCRVMAVFALSSEVLAPLALFSRVFRLILIPSLFMMQMGNELLLGISFRQFMLCYIFWVPWNEIGAWLVAASDRYRLAPRRVTVLFDGSCGLCTRTMGVLRRFDLLHRVEIMDVINQWAEVSARYPSLNQNDCLAVMHAVDERGEVTTGFYAYRRLAATVPIGWLLWPLLFVPGVPAAGQAVYQKIANGRFRTACQINGAAMVGSSR